MNRRIALGAALVLMTATLALAGSPAQADACGGYGTFLDGNPGQFEVWCGGTQKSRSVSCDVSTTGAECQARVAVHPNI